MRGARSAVEDAGQPRLVGGADPATAGHQRQAQLLCHLALADHSPGAIRGEPPEGAPHLLQQPVGLVGRSRPELCQLQPDDLAHQPTRLVQQGDPVRLVGAVRH